MVWNRFTFRFRNTLQERRIYTPEKQQRRGYSPMDHIRMSRQGDLEGLEASLAEAPDEISLTDEVSKFKSYCRLITLFISFAVWTKCITLGFIFWKYCNNGMSSLHGSRCKSARLPKCMDPSPLCMWRFVKNIRTNINRLLL